MGTESVHVPQALPEIMLPHTLTRETLCAQPCLGRNVNLPSKGYYTLASCGTRRKRQRPGIHKEGTQHDTLLNDRTSTFRTPTS